MASGSNPIGNLTILVSADLSELQDDLAQIPQLLAGVAGSLDLSDTTDSVDGLSQSISDAADAATDAQESIAGTGDVLAATGQDASDTSDALDEAATALSGVGDASEGTQASLDSATEALSMAAAAGADTTEAVSAVSDALSSTSDEAADTEASLADVGDAISEVSEAASEAQSYLDDAGESLSSIGEDAKDAEGDLADAGEAASESGEQANESSSWWEALIAAFAGTSEAAAETEEGVKEVGEVVEEAGEGAEEGSEALEGLTENLTELAAEAGLAFSAYEILKESFEDFSEIQKASIALTAMSGDADGVEESLENLKTIALDNGLSFPSLVQADQRMVAFGFDAEQIPTVLQAVADASAATGNGFDEITSSIERLSLSGLAGARQLATIGLNLNTLADAINAVNPALDVTADSAAKAFKALDVSDRVEVLTEALQKFQGVGEQVGQSLSGQWQDTKTNLETAFEEIGGALAPLATKFLNFVNFMLAGLPTLVGWVENLISPITALWDKLSQAFSPGSLGSFLGGQAPNGDTVAGLGSSLIPGSTGPAANQGDYSTGLGITVQSSTQQATQTTEQLNQALTDAQANLALVNTAFKEGAASSDQLATAQQAVKDAFLAANPQFQAGAAYTLNVANVMDQLSVATVPVTDALGKFQVDVPATAQAWTSYYQSLQQAADIAEKQAESFPQALDYIQQLAQALPPASTATDGLATANQNVLNSMLAVSAQVPVYTAGAYNVSVAELQLQEATNAANLVLNNQVGFLGSLTAAIQPVTQSIEKGLGSALASIVTGTKSVSAAFQAMGTQILSVIIDQIIKIGIADLLNSLANVNGSIGSIAQTLGGKAAATGPALQPTLEQLGINAQTPLPVTITSAPVAGIGDTSLPPVLAQTGGVGDLSQIPQLSNTVGQQVTATGALTEATQSATDGLSSVTDSTTALTSGVTDLTDITTDATKASVDVTEGLSSVSSGLTDVSQGLSEATQATSEAVQASGEVASVTASAAQTGASVAGAATSVISSGITGLVGAIGSVGSFITGIIGNFQQATANDTLWRIMQNTLGIFNVVFQIQQMDTGVIRDNMIELNAYLNGTLNTWLGMIDSDLQGNTNDNVSLLTEINGTLMSMYDLQLLSTSLAAKPSLAGQLQVTLTNTDPRQVAQQLAAFLGLSGPNFV